MHVILKPSVVLLVAVALVLVGAGAFMARLNEASAAGGGPEMRLTANGCTANCTFANGETFTLAVEIVTAPAGGYTTAQSFIDYGPDLTYDASLLSAADEIVWPDCLSSVAVRGETGPTFVNHGCLTDLFPPLPVSNYVGSIVEISVTCSAAGSTTEIRLLPRDDPDAGTSGATFVAGDGTTQVVPIVSNLSVTCGAGEPTPTPTPTATPGGPEVRLTALGCAADCTFANDEKFTLVVEVVEAPAAGYVLAQSFIDFGTDLTYDITLVSAADEITWADCEGLTAVRAQIGGSQFVNHGCLTGLLPPQPVSNFVGSMVEISLTCSSENSSTEVMLLPLGDTAAGTSGAAFAEPDTSQVTPKVSNLSVTCGAAPVDTPTPEGPTATVGPTDTPGPTATTGPTNTPAPPTDTPVPTPVPEFQCGDVDRDGSVSVLDALWVLWFDAGLIDFILPIKDNDRDAVPDLIADIDGDGVVNSIDAALILQIEAGLYSCA